jgi:RNA polymerase-binding transcription factor DksA
LAKDERVRTHTYQYKLTTPVPNSTPPEHRPNTDDPPYKHDLERASATEPTTAADIAAQDAILANLESTRENQLATLADPTEDPVAIAYRDSVKRILGEIRIARHRLREGKLGVCVDCHGAVTAERLEALPWATQCTDCARRRYSGQNPRVATPSPLRGGVPARQVHRQQRAGRRSRRPRPSAGGQTQSSQSQPAMSSGI